MDLYINGHDHCLEHIGSPDRYKMGVSLRKIKEEKGDLTGMLFVQSNSISDEWWRVKGMEGRCAMVESRGTQVLLRRARVHVSADYCISS